MHPVRRSLRDAPVLFAIAAAGAGLLPGPAGAQEELLQELKTIASVRLEGRHQVPAGTLRRALKTTPPSFWPWRERPVVRFDYLKADVIALGQVYRRHGFLDARADYQVVAGPGNDVVGVVFRIVEGARSRVRRVDVEGVTALRVSDLRRRLWARTGRPFDPAYLQLDTLRIAALLQERGHLPSTEASYRRGEEDSLEIDVRYVVHEGRRLQVGTTTVTGLDRVSERQVLRELVLPEGSMYQRSRLLRSEERLYESGLFGRAEIEPRLDSTATRLDFAVSVAERRPRWIDAGIGSGTAERFRLQAEWGNRNLMRRGLQGEIGSRLTFDRDFKFQRFRGEASLVEPWLLRTRTRGRVTPYIERYDDRAEPAWIVRQEFAGINFELRRELNRFARVTLTQENLFARQAFTIQDTSLSGAQRDSLEASVVPEYTTHRIGLGFERDTRENPFQPQQGATTVVTAEVAGGPLKGTSSFRKLQVSGTWYTPVQRTWVLATRASAGVIDPYGPRESFSPEVVIDEEVSRVPLEDRFRIGGVNSIRGYDERSIPASGGLAVIQAGIELRIPTSVRLPFLGLLGFETFVDAGNVWARPEYIRWEHLVQADDGDPNSVRVVAGLGPRLDLPVGPLRVDLTWRWRPTRSHVIVQFAVGPSF